VNKTVKPTYEELSERCDGFQTEIIHSMVVKQDLVDARDALDHDLHRFRTIQSYSQSALQAVDLPDLGRLTVESMIEAFEVEGGAVYLKETDGPALRMFSAYGLANIDKNECLGRDYIESCNLERTETAIIEQVDSATSPWANLNLNQVILSPFFDTSGDLEGLLVGGISTDKSPYYEKFTDEMAPGFMVFTQHFATILHNLLSRDVISKQVRDLERLVTELSSVHTIGTAITSILDLDQLLDAVLETVVNDLGYDRGLIMLADSDRGTLTHGRAIGPDEMVRFVEQLELPLNKNKSALAKVALTGMPMLVRDMNQADVATNKEVIAVLNTQSFLAVPLTVQGKSVGVMAVDNYESGKKLSSKDIDLMSTLAPQVAVSIENARLYDDMRELNESLELEIAEREQAQEALRMAHAELEHRVDERTAELSMSNSLLITEVAERTRIEAELKTAMESAESANRAKSDFLANMSHELRTPMNAVIGFSEMILDGIYGTPPTEVLEAVAEIQQSGMHLLGLINDVLDISKIEAGRMVLNLSENAPEEPIDTVVGRMMSLVKEKGLELHIETDEGLPTLDFDLQRITQVLLNLVGNAIKFTHSGEIHIGARTQEHEIEFSVSDTGRGIPKADQDRIFSAFQQADSSISREAQGTGLGLAISKRFVEMHGGRIWVNSEFGRGSVFRFTLPVRRRT
jgi:signal transduction histidine kinase